MLGANRLIFALDPKLALDAETLVSHSGPKFLCFVVNFNCTFDFGTKQKLCPKNLCSDLASVRNHVS